MLITSDNYWLLLEKSDDTRISKGIDGYEDETGEIYRYDSLVPNHKNLRPDDCIVLRKENNILGYGRIESITEGAGTKIHRRCPNCNGTDIRERTTREPVYKCGNCSHEFDNPETTSAEVTTFSAAIADFTLLNNPPTVKAVKECAIGDGGARSQLSMIQLDPNKIVTLLEGRVVAPVATAKHKSRGGQGFGLSYEERNAVELRAMRMVRKLYEEEGWEVVDHSRSESFDFKAIRDGKTCFIEVKGSTGPGKNVILTKNEVNHVKDRANHCALVVIANIQLEKIEGKWRASGGELSLRDDPWLIDDDRLEATQYRYTVQV